MKYRLNPSHAEIALSVAQVEWLRCKSFDIEVQETDELALALDRLLPEMPLRDPRTCQREEFHAFLGKRRLAEIGEVARTQLVEEYEVLADEELDGLALLRDRIYDGLSVVGCTQSKCSQVCRGPQCVEEAILRRRLNGDTYLGKRARLRYSQACAASERLRKVRMN